MVKMLALCGKGVREPVELFACNCQHVKTAIHRVKAGTSLRQPHGGGMQQSLLFASGDAGCGITKMGVAPIAHFDKYPNMVIAHDQIQFTAA